MLRDIYRRASLSNEGDRAALLEHPQYLVLPDGPVLRGRTHLAERSDGGVVGFATVEVTGRGAELVDLFVDPANMRQGVATTLIDAAVTRLAAEGIKEMQTTANRHALKFYLATGFETLDTIRTPLGSGVRMRLRFG